MPVAGFIERVVDVPDGVQVQIEGGHVVVKGPRHALRRTLSHPRIRIQVDGKQVKIRSEFPRRKDGALVGTFAAHLRNMIVGVTDGFTYEMKIVYSHFPLKTTIVGETKVEVKGDQVVLTGPDIEAVSQTAANIEQATRIRGFDPRIFQDGIYITKKAGEA